MNKIQASGDDQLAILKSSGDATVEQVQSDNKQFNYREIIQCIYLVLYLIHLHRYDDASWSGQLHDSLANISYFFLASFRY